MSIKKQPQGFTIIELLIYLSVIATAVVIFTTFTADVVKRTARILNAKEVTQNSRLIASRISQEIKTAKSIDSLAADELVLTNYDDETITIDYDGVNDIVQITDPGGTVAITNNKVRVTNIVFNQITTDAISFRLVVEQGNPNAPQNLKYSLDFTTVVTPRPAIY